MHSDDWFVMLGSGAATARPRSVPQLRHHAVASSRSRSMSLPRKLLAVLASDASAADDDLPAVFSPEEPGHAGCAERADESGANDLRLGIREGHVKNAMAAITAGPRGVLIVPHRILVSQGPCPTKVCRYHYSLTDLSDTGYEERCPLRGRNCGTACCLRLEHGAPARGTRDANQCGSPKSRRARASTARAPARRATQG
jgi:hypothetical protein